MTPDTALAAEWRPSPNHGERIGGRPPDMLVLHYTGMPGAEAALARLCCPAAEVSAHYVVRECGRILQLVAESRRAWHAGAGCWAGLSDINSASIGIEIVHPGHAGGLPPYPDAQIDAVTRLGLDIARRWTIAPERVLAHSDVAPDRKEDPGEVFPWQRLHRAGLGHWVAPAPLVDGPTLAEGSTGDDVAGLQAALRDYGFGLQETGRYDAATASVVRAFQRHFRPGRIDGVADQSTRTTLDALRASRPGSGAQGRSGPRR